MSFTINEQKKYNLPVEKINSASLSAIHFLGGKVLNQKESAGKIKAQLDKTILGKVVGERTQINLTLNELSPQECSLDIEAYPLDAIGRKLMFGARKGVTRKVVDWYFQYLEEQL